MNPSSSVSARNRWSGTVADIVTGPVSSEVTVACSTVSVTATVTHDSVAHLDLGVDSEVEALVKASSILLMSSTQKPIVSARNIYRGQVESVVEGPVNGEVVVDVDGLKVVAIVTRSSIDALAIAPAVPLWVVFKASSVMLTVGASG